MVAQNTLRACKGKHACAPVQGVGVDSAPASHGKPNQLKEERDYNFCSECIV